MPTWNLVALRVFEGLSLALLAGVVWFCVVRPWRRTGKLSLDGKFLLGDGSSIGMPVVVSRFCRACQATRARRQSERLVRRLARPNLAASDQATIGPLTMADGINDSGHEDASERIEMIEAATPFAFVCMSDDFHPGGPTAVSNRIGALNFGVRKGGDAAEMVEIEIG